MQFYSTAVTQISEPAESYLTVNLNWNGCLPSSSLTLRRYTEGNSWRPYNWESRHCAHFSPRHVSVHCDSVREMILHCEKGENTCAIYSTEKMADPWNPEMQTDAQFSFDLARYTRVVNRVLYKEWQKGLSRSCWQYTLFENWKTSPYVVNQQSLVLWWTGNVPRTTSYLSVSSLRTCRKRLSGGRHASELLVRSPMSCTNRDGKKLLEASKSWLPSGVGLMAASPEHLSEWSQYSVDTGLTMYAHDHQIY